MGRGRKRGGKATPRGRSQSRNGRPKAPERKREARSRSRSRSRPAPNHDRPRSRSRSRSRTRPNPEKTEHYCARPLNNGAGVIHEGPKALDISKLTDDDTSQLSVIPVDVTLNTFMVQRFLLSVTSVVFGSVQDNDMNQEMQWCFLMFRDALANYPTSGVYPKIILDVSAALKAKQVGHHGFGFTNATTSLTGITIPDTVAEMFFRNGSATDANGYFTAGTAETTYDINVTQSFLTKYASKVANLKDAKKYVSKFHKDPSIFAYEVPFSGDAGWEPRQQFSSGVMYRLGGQMSTEEGLPSPWLAALRFVDNTSTGNQYRVTRGESVRCYSGVGATVWAAMHHGYSYAHNVRVKPVNIGEYMQRMIYYVEQVDSLNGATNNFTGTFSKEDLLAYVSYICISHFDPWGICGLGVVWGSDDLNAVSTFVTARITPTIANGKLPFALMRSLSLTKPAHLGKQGFIVPVPVAVYSTGTFTYANSYEAAASPGFSVAPDFGLLNPNPWVNNRTGALMRDFSSTVVRVMAKYMRVSERIIDDTSDTTAIHTLLQYGTLNNSSTLPYGLSSNVPTTVDLMTLVTDYVLPCCNAKYDPYRDFYAEWHLQMIDRGQVTLTQMQAAAIRDAIVTEGTMVTNINNPPIEGGGMSSDNGLPMWGSTAENPNPMVRDMVHKLSRAGYNPKTVADFQDLASATPLDALKHHPIVEALSEIVPKYGNYGGPNWMGGQRVAGKTPSVGSLRNALPSTEEDLLYANHDMRYGVAKTDEDIRRADLKLANELDELRKRGKLSLYGLAAEILMSYKGWSPQGLSRKKDNEAYSGFTVIAPPPPEAERPKRARDEL